MIFYYIFSDLEGSASDLMMFYDACITDLPIPAGIYYLADKGFPVCTSLVIPIRGKHYHLQKWGHTNFWCIILSNIMVNLIS